VGKKRRLSNLLFWPTSSGSNGEALHLHMQTSTLGDLPNFHIFNGKIKMAHCEKIKQNNLGLCRQLHLITRSNKKVPLRKNRKGYCLVQDALWEAGSVAYNERQNSLVIGFNCKLAAYKRNALTANGC
jgi:hypothetical protein